jgi:hypothetical protein
MVLEYDVETGLAVPSRHSGWGALRIVRVRDRRGCSTKRMRKRFAELGVSYIARPVPVEAADREELRRKAGTDEIPALVLKDGMPVPGGAEEIITHLDRRYSGRADAHAIGNAPPNRPEPDQSKPRAGELRLSFQMSRTPSPDVDRDRHDRVIFLCEREELR